MTDRQRTPEDIRRDIERTRADMDETVQAIGERMSPGQIIDQVWDKVRGGEAAASFGHVVKEHPVPALLMGLGLGWLMYERGNMNEGEKLRRKFGDVGPGTYSPAEGRVGPYTGEQVGISETGDGFGDRARSALSSARDTASAVGEKLSGAASSMGQKLSSVGDRMGSMREGTSERAAHLRESSSERMQHMRERASELRDRTGELGHQARERAGELSQRTREGVTRAYGEQPLALGAVAFGLGLASGLMVPSTRWEDQTMGRRADTLKDEVKRTGSETLESAKRVAEEAKDTARDVIEREGLLDDLKEKARHIAEETRSAASRAADREGLNAEGLKNRGRSVSESVRGKPA